MIVSESKDNHRVKNIAECGKIVHQLITGVKESPHKSQYFGDQIEALKEFDGHPSKGSVFL